VVRFVNLKTSLKIKFSIDGSSQKFTKRTKNLVRFVNLRNAPNRVRGAFRKFKSAVFNGRKLSKTGHFGGAFRKFTKRTTDERAT